MQNIYNRKREGLFQMPANVEFDRIDICANERYLAMTGRIVVSDEDVTPMLMGWDIKENTEKVYAHTSDKNGDILPHICEISHLCVYSNIAISKDGKIYALLDHRLLYIWDADTMEVLTITNTSPGVPEYPGRREFCLHAWLRLSEDNTDDDEDKSTPFLVTVDRDLQAILILDRLGNRSKEIGFSQLRTPFSRFSPVIILDVIVNRSFILLQYAETQFSPPFPSYFVIPLPLGMFIQYKHSPFQNMPYLM